MYRSVVVALLSLTAAGCAANSDPCDGKKGVCLSVRVEGAATGLDQLLVTVDKPTLKSLRTPVPAAAFSLPVQLALILPAATSGAVNVTVDGLGKGKALASDSKMVTVVAGHAAVKVTLKSGTAACATPCEAPMKCEPASATCVGCLANADCAAGQFCDTTAGVFACKTGCRVTADCVGKGINPECCNHGCVDLNADPQNCGACATACTLAHATAKCESGCKVATCAAGFGNCNGIDTDGCEVNTATDPLHCGACGTACAGVHGGTLTCTAGACGFTLCEPGFADCDADPTNGCETSTDTDPMHCGTCGTVCSETHVGMTSCSSGVCGYVACDPGFADCDTDPTNGCEHAVNTLSECGACGRACAPANVTGANCSASGVCDYAACASTFVDVDGVRANGCEVNSDNDPANCGGIGRHCSSSGVNTLKCAGGKCTSTCLSGLGNCNTPPSPAPDDGCEVNLNTDINHCGHCARPCAATQVNARMCNAGVCNSTCLASNSNCNQPAAPTPDDGCESIACGAGGCINSVCRTVAGFNGGSLGPDFTLEGYSQCVGYLDTMAADEIPATNWASQCKVASYNKLRVACGASSASYRYIDVNKNVFRDGLAAFPEPNLITGDNFSGGYLANSIYADPVAGPWNPDQATTWWAGGSGCGETTVQLTINNSCPWDASDCFGQNLAGDRFLYVYIHK